MRIDKPVFCFQINGELYKHLGLSVDTQAHRGYLRASLLSTVQAHYASHAQIIECFHDDPSFVEELKELARLQFFVSLSRQSTVIEFLEGRRRLYDWDRLSYPMYFKSDLAFLRDFPTVSHADPSTTTALRKEYGGLYQHAPPKFENWLDLQERGVLQKNAQTIARFVNSEDGALTAAYFKRVPGLLDANRLQNLLSKILPSQFTNIYQDVFEGYTATGIPYLAAFEDKRSFPYCDFGIVSSIFIKLGLQQLIFDSSAHGVSAFLAYRMHRNFPELVRAKDRLLYVLAQDDLRAFSLERPALQIKIRGLPEVQLIGGARNDPLAAASELYRLTERFCSDDQSAARRKLEMPDALSWKGKYVIFTATDVEDDELHHALTASGFGPKIVEHHDKFTCVTRFRADVGKVFHVSWERRSFRCNHYESERDRCAQAEIRNQRGNLLRNEGG